MWDIGSGLALGAGFGLVIGAAFFDNAGMGLVFGSSIGLVLGAIAESVRKKSAQKKEPPEGGPK